jgi:hypothetical protein
MMIKKDTFTNFLEKAEVNFCGMIDNILKLADITSSNSLSVQFGINFTI